MNNWAKKYIDRSIENIVALMRLKVLALYDENKLCKVLISDKALRSIPVKDNGEYLINLQASHPEIVIEINPASKQFQNLLDNECYVREGVAQRLCVAQDSMPDGYRIKIWDGYRPIDYAKKLYDDFISLCEAQSDVKPFYLSKEAWKEKAALFVAPPDIIPPHCTGGAVDITIVGPDDCELDMGGNYDSYSAGKTHTFTCSCIISRISKVNRAMLVDVMTKAGFVNYPTEWWHWSYGDSYWAAALHKNNAVYGCI